MHSCRLPENRLKRTNYGWVAGGMRGIKHEAFIARGGFGEVHKVASCFTSLTLGTDAERVERSCIAEDLIFVRVLTTRSSPEKLCVSSETVLMRMPNARDEREGRMLSELCPPGRNPTVVVVTKHGWLPRQPSLY
jgi:hypothetical protein